MMTDDEHNGTAAADLMMTNDRCFGRVSTVIVTFTDAARFIKSIKEIISSVSAIT